MASIIYDGQLSHAVDSFYVLAKFKLPKLNCIPMISWKMPVDCNDCDYLSPHNVTKMATCREMSEMAKYNLCVM